MDLTCLKKQRFGNDSGFTLIEMAIVLVIIGLIIGAVVKGQDLIQSAKQKKFYTKSLKAWELAVVNYYDRTGKVLGDSTDNGQFNNVNGSTFSNSGGIDDTLKKVGLTAPVSNTSQSGQFTFKGKYSGTQTITLYLKYLNNYNCLYFTKMPTDLAIALDTMIDGKMDATAGSFRQKNETDWPADASVTPTVNAMYILDIP